jgi:integrase
MPRIAGSVTPKYRKHKASGQAVVTIAGRDHYLGPWRSKASKIEYDRLIGEWLAAGRPSSGLVTTDDLTVTELLLRYWRFAQQHYRKDGKPTGEVNNIRLAAKPLKALYGHTRAADFGPLALKALRENWIRLGLCRNLINQRAGIIRRIFKWGVSEQLVPPAVLQGLQAVDGLRRGRSEARETEPVGPVDDVTVDATLPHLPPVVADMVRFQRLVGCRPGEVCSLRPCDVDTSGDVWVYRPASHKTEHHGRERRIYIGPQAQDVLRAYLLRDKESLCFTPADSERKRLIKIHERRVTPMSCGNRPGTNRRKKPKQRPNDHYTKDGYARAIRRACDAAWPAPESLSDAAAADWRYAHRWAPNRLRHSVATKLRASYGIEAAQTVLGHADPKVTLTYAERDFALAARIMREVG